MSSGQFSVHVYCGQTAGCIKIPLGMEVGLGPGDSVFDGDPATPRKRTQPPHPIFGPCLLWPNGWMDEVATWNGSRPRPRPNCIRRGPSYPRKGHSSPPPFGPCLLWPRSPISATTELLLALPSYECPAKCCGNVVPLSSGCPVRPNSLTSPKYPALGNGAFVTND